MSRPLATLFVIACAALPLLAVAHGIPPAPAHGGRVLEADENWVELVLTGTRVQVYVLDETRKPITAAKLAGSATVLAGGKPCRVKLLPGVGNELDAVLSAPAGSKDAAVVSLTINGQRANVHYASGS